MAYEMEDIRKSQEIFYYLLEHHELQEEDEAELFRAYSEIEEVQMLLKSQGDKAHCTIERYGDVIYLIPDDANYVLGYSKRELKETLLRGNATDKDYYLLQFSILVLLLEFYDGQGKSSKTRDYIRVGELLNSISTYLKEASEKYDESEQEAIGIAFFDMRNSFEALKSVDMNQNKGKLSKTTKEGFLYHMLDFLQEQGLIDYIKQDEMIKTTKKLDLFMDCNLLNQINYERIKKILEEAKYE